MALIQGHQLRKILAQNVWKVVGAFSLGIVAVVGAGLILSDVHRIPQGRRSFRTAIQTSPEKSESSVPKPSRDEAQPVQIIQDGGNVNSSPPQEPERSSYSDPATPLGTQNDLVRPSRRKHPSSSTVAKVPNNSSVAENRPPLVAPFLPITSPIPQTAPVAAAGDAGGTASTPSAADSRLTLAPETSITVRLTQQISSKKNRTGEVFRGTLTGPLTARGIVVAEAGAPVLGRIVEARSARIFRGGSNLNLELTDVGTTGGLVKVKTTQWYETGSHSRVVKAAMLPTEAAKKVASGMKPEGDGVPSSPGRANAAAQDDTGERSEKKGSSVTLPPGSEIVFKLLEPLTVTGSPEHR